ncbi:MAG: DMT family transporter [Treponema sp.]|nr:DMT family transporter [Treponema sp.]
MKISENTKGIICIVISAFFFAMMAVFVKLAGDIYFIQKAFFRNAVAFVTAMFSVMAEAKRKGKESVAIPKGALIFLCLRSITGCAGIFGNFYAIDRLVLSDAAILNKMAPFFAILFSFILLKEKIRTVPLIAIIVAFLGSMLVIKPTFDFSQMIPSLSGFLSGVGAGFAYACVRKLSTMKCNGKVVVLFFSGFTMLISAPYLVLRFNPMTWQQLLFLIGAGVCGAGGQFSITAAYFHAPAREISIYDYSQIIFSTLLGLIFFGQLPDILSLIGYIVIVAMAVMNFVYNKNLNKK